MNNERKAYDICPANILVEKNTENLKIIDFGLSYQWQNNMKN